MTTIPADRLDKLVSRWQTVQTTLASGADQESYVRLSREFAELDPIVATITELRRAIGERADLQQLVDDPASDPEMAALAEAELGTLDPKIDDKSAAGMMLKGMTAEYLLHRTFKVQKGQTVLVHAAAGWYDAGKIDCTAATYKGMTMQFGVGPHPEDWYGTLATAQRVCVYCKAGSRSRTAADFLVAKGYTDIADLLGGFDGWTGDVEY